MKAPWVLVPALCVLLLSGRACKAELPSPQDRQLLAERLAALQVMESETRQRIADVERGIGRQPVPNAELRDLLQDYRVQLDNYQRDIKALRQRLGITVPGVAPTWQPPDDLWADEQMAQCIVFEEMTRGAPYFFANGREASGHKIIAAITRCHERIRPNTPVPEPWLRSVGNVDTTYELPLTPREERARAEEVANRGANNRQRRSRWGDDGPPPPGADSQQQFFRRGDGGEAAAAAASARPRGWTWALAAAAAVQQTPSAVRRHARDFGGTVLARLSNVQPALVRYASLTPQTRGPWTPGVAVQGGPPGLLLKMGKP